MKTKSILGIVLMGIICLCMMGCQNDDFMDKTNPLRTAQEGMVTGDTWSLTLEATISDAADTRAVELVQVENKPDTLNGYWVVGEKIGVYLKGVKLGYFTVTEVIANTNRKSAKFYGTGLLETGMENDGNYDLTLIYPDNADADGNNAWYYTDQNGALTAASGPSISSNYDYMIASLTVKKNGSSITVITTSTRFTCQQSIYRFGFKDSDNGNADIYVKQFTVGSARNQIVQQRTFDNDKSKWAIGSLTVKPTSATTDLLYVSIYNIMAGNIPSGTAANSVQDAYQFDAVDNNNALYMGTQEIKAEFFKKQSQFNSFQNVAMKKATLTPETSTTSDAW